LILVNAHPQSAGWLDPIKIDLFGSWVFCHELRQTVRDCTNLIGIWPAHAIL